MSMDLDDLESRFHTLADDLSAPPTDDARSAITRRSHVLRRRRQTRRAVGSAFVVVALVAGIAALQNRRGDELPAGPVDRPDVSTGQPPSDFRAWTLDLPGWEVRNVGGHVDVTDRNSVGDGSMQVFRAGDDPLGPTVLVRHLSASDPATGSPESDTVEVGSADGYLTEVGPERHVLSWNPPIGDTVVEMMSYGLDREQVVALAGGLVPNDDDIAYPPASDDRFGFEATSLPADIEEVVSVEAARDARDIRLVELWPSNSDGSSVEGTIGIEVDSSGATFAMHMAEGLVHTENVEQVEVAGHEAYLFDNDVYGTSVVWRQDDASVRVGIPTDLVTVAEVVDALRPMTEDEWRELDPTVTAGADGACCA